MVDPCRVQCPERTRADVLRRGAGGKLPRQVVDRYWQETPQCGQGLRIRAAIEEDTVESGQGHLAPLQLLPKMIERPRVVMRDDLGQEVLGAEVFVGEKSGLRRRVSVRIGPAAERQVRHMFMDETSQLPGVLDASLRSDVAIAAEHDKRTEPLVPGAFGIREAKIQGMFRRQEWRDVIPRHV